MAKSFKYKVMPTAAPAATTQSVTYHIQNKEVATQ
jgi:hypothetical protein